MEIELKSVSESRKKSFRFDFGGYTHRRLPMSSLEHSKTERFSLGDWRAEPSTGLLHRDGQKERLEPRVMSILCLLASEPGRVFSKRELFDGVWGLEIVEDVTLSRCISDLRRALGDDARNPSYIETIPKKGYRLIAGVGEPEAVAESDLEAAGPTHQKSVVLGAALVVLVVVGFLVWQFSTRPDQGSKDGPQLSAYDYYLQGRDHYKKYRRAENEQAIELFRLAVDVDPSFALGHAGLANALALQEGNFGVPGNWAEQAMESAARALELQPDLAEGYKAMAHVLTVQERYGEATEHFRQALEFRPDYREAISGLGLTLYLQGEFIEGLAQIQKAHSLGFEGSNTAQHIGWIYWRLGLYDDAEQWFRRALEFEPHHTGAWKGLAWVDLSRGEIESARQQIGRLLDVHPECVTCLALAGDIELAGGDLDAARSYFQRAFDVRAGTYIYGALRLGQVLGLLGEERAGAILTGAARDAEHFIESGSDELMLPWIIAAVSALRGDPDQAMKQLQVVWEEGFRRWDLDDSAFESMRDDPTYQALLQKNRDSLLEDRARIQELGVDPQ
jgi:DNA-binding winged helix-turn-helix (wHTH) protein/Tfp pilus assembly protein PilF